MSIIDNIKIKHGIDKDGKYFFEKEVNDNVATFDGSKDYITRYPGGKNMYFDEGNTEIKWSNNYVDLSDGENCRVFIVPKCAEVADEKLFNDIYHIVLDVAKEETAATDSNKNPVTKENFNSEFAAKAIENRLGVRRGEPTQTATSVTGEKYITFAGNSIKEEGQMILGWRDTPDIAWEVFIEAIQREYFNYRNKNYKIYWRQKPRLEFYFERQAYAVYARFLISDKPKIAAETEKISNDTWVERYVPYEEGKEYKPGEITYAKSEIDWEEEEECE